MTTELRLSLAEDPKKKFGAYIHERRLALQLPMRRLAEMVGLSPSYLRDIELGNRQAPKNQLSKLAQALEIPEDELSLFYDLAGASRGYQYEDINPYLEQQELARVALRMTRDAGLDNEAWQRIISEISKSTKRD